MKIVTALLTATVVASVIVPAHADRPGPDWMPLDQAFRTLNDAGYRDVSEIEADDGAWEAKATKDGTAVKVRVDPRTGAITPAPKR